MIKSLNNYTLKEFQEIENFGKDSLFDSVIIVPTNEVHDSGFRCMKFILVNEGGIVGAVGGGSDVVHPNGIGNHGKEMSYFDSLSKQTIPYMGLSLDCLRESNCVRIMMSKLCKCDSFIGSDFQFFMENE